MLRNMENTEHNVEHKSASTVIRLVALKTGGDAECL